MQKERALTARKAAQARVEKMKAQKLKEPKKQEKSKLKYTLPVAADEPTYCYCGDVSYGEMIACENEVCMRVEMLLIIVLSERVVSFGLCWVDCCTKGEMVLSRL